MDQWSRDARTQLLEAYLAELASAGRSELLDERLVAPFEAEQLCREIVYAEQHIPAWVYAPLGGLWQEYPVTDTVRAGRHGKHTVPTSPDQVPLISLLTPVSPTSPVTGGTAVVEVPSTATEPGRPVKAVRRRR